MSTKNRMWVKKTVKASFVVTKLCKSHGIGGEKHYSLYNVMERGRDLLYHLAVLSLSGEG